MPIIATAQLTIVDSTDPHVSPSAPSAPAVNALWLDTSVTPNMLKRWDGALWVEVGSDVDLSDYYTKTDLNTRFEQTNESIALKADATVTNSLGERLETAEATLTTQAGEITAVVSKANGTSTALSNLTVGTRNYLLDSYTTVAINSPDAFVSAATDRKMMIADDFYTDTANKQITLSFYYKIDGAVRESSSSYLRLHLNGRSATGATMRFASQAVSTGTRIWTRQVTIVYVSSTLASIDSVTFDIVGYKGSVQIKNPQVELGTKATSYAPAPEDDKIVRQEDAPPLPYENSLWLDTSISPNLLKRWDGSAWVTVNDTEKLTDRIESAELKLLPNALMTSVKSTDLYRTEKYGERNYALQSHGMLTFIDSYYRYASGTTTTYTTMSVSVSKDLFEHSGKGTSIRISFDIKRTDLVPASTGIYSGVWIYYRYYAADGVTVSTTGRGWYLRSTDSDYATTDDDWLRITKGPINIATYDPIEIAYFAYGTGSAVGTTGTVQFRNVKLEVGSRFTAWSPAPEDLSNIPSRMTTAESSIIQQSNQIALKVSSSTYNMEKVYRSTTAPSTYGNALWLDISLSPPILKRWSGSAWVAVGAQEIKTSGITIGTNNVSITTEQFLLQLLDPNDNENVLMEMSANGKVGFKELYADEVISSSIAPAYNAPKYLYVNTSYSGSSDTYFRSLAEAVKQVNNKYLSYDVYIYLPSSGEIYEYDGVHISGINGSGKLTIYGYTNTTLNSYITIKGCTVHIALQNINLREIRSLNSGSRNSYLVSCTMNHFVEINNCTLDANSTTYDSVYAKASQVYLFNVGLYNALQGLEVFTGTAYMKNCKGSCTWSMACYAGILFAAGTVPEGSKSTGENGQIFATGVTVDYGTAIPVVPPENTAKLYADTKSWRGSWRTDTLDVIQGVYSDAGYYSGLNWHRGCMWFSSLKSVLAGTTIKSATLTLHRKAGSGSFSAMPVYLCAISNTWASGTPSILVNYGSIGTIGRDSQVTFTIPNAAVTGLASGLYGGLCLYEPIYNFGSSTYSNGYMRMAGSDLSTKPYLLVVYSGSTAVG